MPYPAYFFGLHIFGAICLVPWIKLAPPVYKETLKESALGETWWYVLNTPTSRRSPGL